MFSGQKMNFAKIEKKNPSKNSQLHFLEGFFWQKATWQKKFHWFLISKIGSVMSQVMN